MINLIIKIKLYFDKLKIKNKSEGKYARCFHCTFFYCLFSMCKITALSINKYNYIIIEMLMAKKKKTNKQTSKQKTKTKTKNKTQYFVYAKQPNSKQVNILSVYFLCYRLC